jgi:hypothetical protein
LKVLTNSDIIRIVTKWQKAGFVHEMTCATDGCKTVLEPIERKGEVRLKCPACVHEEAMIPQKVLNSEERIDRIQRIQSQANAERPAPLNADLLFKLMAAALCAIVCGSFIDHLYGTCLGLLVGATLLWLEYRKHP